MRPHLALAAIAGAILLPLAVLCLTRPQSTNEGSRRDIPVLQSTCLIGGRISTVN
jgi:hypothetical protein